MGTQTWRGNLGAPPNLCHQLTGENRQEMGEPKVSKPKLETTRGSSWLCASPHFYPGGQSWAPAVYFIPWRSELSICSVLYTLGDTQVRTYSVLNALEDRFERLQYTLGQRAENLKCTLLNCKFLVKKFVFNFIKALRYQGYPRSPWPLCQGRHAELEGICIWVCICTVHMCVHMHVHAHLCAYVYSDMYMCESEWACVSPTPAQGTCMWYGKKRKDVTGREWTWGWKLQSYISSPNREDQCMLIGTAMLSQHPAPHLSKHLASQATSSFWQSPNITSVHNGSRCSNMLWCVSHMTTAKSTWLWLFWGLRKSQGALQKWGQKGSKRQNIREFAMRFREVDRASPSGLNLTKNYRQLRNVKSGRHGLPREKLTSGLPRTK